MSSTSSTTTASSKTATTTRSLTSPTSSSQPSSGCCDTFTQNAWRPDLCSTCQRSKSEHDGVKDSSSATSHGSSSRSWRRRSEPDPNSNIAGVRISALASKFQGREVRSGSIPEAGAGSVHERAKTLDRHLAKSSERKLNASHSSELLDSTSSTRISSSSSTTTSSSPTTQSSTSSAISSKISVNGPTPQPKSISLLKSKTVDCSVQSTKNVPVKTLGSVLSSLKSEKDDVNKGKSSKQPQQQKKRNIRRVSIPDVRPEVIGEDGGLDNLAAESEEGEVTAGEEADQIYLSLTDEEKQFALLALGNTVWNSDTRNLQVELGADSRRACREFEDLQVEQLFESEEGRFSSLLDCDKVKAAADKKNAASFGTFPQAVGSSRQPGAKVSLAEIKFEKNLVNGDSKGLSSGPGIHKHNGFDSKMKRTEGPGESHTISDITESLYETIPDDIEPAPSPKSAPRGRSSIANKNSRKGRGGNSASNSSERGGGGGGGGGGRKPAPQNQTMSPPPRASTKMVAKKITLPPRHEESKDNGLDDSVDSTISDDLDTSGNSGGLNDSTAMEGFRAIALLNDVLRDYADLNESSTDDFFSDAQSTTTTTTTTSSLSSAAASKSKKQPPPPPVSLASSTDFEAKMASVAATLDLTKPNQRGAGKRQAPRPPVSPPPEPGASPKRPGTGGKDSQPEPVFKMVPVGRSIMTLPPPQQQPGDPPLSAKSGKSGSVAPAGLEEFVLPPDGSQESLTKAANGENKNKKGITSFFRNILRRGKDSTSSESFESVNTEVQFERKDSTSGPGGQSASGDSNSPTTNNSGGDDDDAFKSQTPPASASSSVDPRAKCLVFPPGSSPTPASNRRESQAGGSSATDAGSSVSKDGAASQKPPLDSTSSSSFSSSTDHDTATTAGATVTTSTTVAAVASSAAAKPASPSPSTQRKPKGLASPKMMLKRATAKFSPPTSRKNQPDKEKDKDKDKDKDSNDGVSNVKPYPAPKPVVPPPAKPPSTAASSSTTISSTGGSDISAKESKDVVKEVVRRRPKSPKRSTAPVPSSRTSVGQAKSGGSDLRNPDLAKELERRLSKTAAEQAGKTAHSPTATSPPVSPIRETENSLPSSPTSSLDFFPVSATSNPNAELSGGSSTSTFEDDAPAKPAPFPLEKIELPTAASSSRKGFLGKLTSGSKQKSRAPTAPSSGSAPSSASAASSTGPGGPSVKRAKSVTESATLPRGDKKNKKFNVADISGPVMVTDITNTKVLENRRNTISLGDEPAFIPFPGSGQSSTTPGSSGMMSTSTVDKGGLDEFDFPVLSPLGSLENLYESILPKQGDGESGVPGDGSAPFHFYDPPTNKAKKPLCPNIPADGYLEPVPPLTVNPASGGVGSVDAILKPPSTASISTSATSLSTAITSSSSTSTNLSSTSSSSSTSSVVTKSPLKSSSSKKLPSPAPAQKSGHIRSRPAANDGGSSGPSSGSEPSTSAENSGENSLPFVKPNGGAANLGVNFVEPEMTEQRRALLAAQPIYEEIPNSGLEDEEEMFSSSGGSGSGGSVGKADTKRSGGFTGGMPASTGLTKAQAAHAWLQQPHVLAGPTPPPTPPPLTTPSSSSLSSSTTTTTTTLTTSPSHHHHHHNTKPSPSPSSNLLSGSMSVSMTLMTTSLTSSMLPPPPPPPDTLPAPPLPHQQLPPTSRSVSRETVSSNESDSQSIGSSGAGNFGFSTLPRPPRPAPRRRPTRRIDPAGGAGGSDQYVSMNRPNAQVSLSEDQLRDVFTKLTNTTFHALQDVYAQCERLLSADRLDIPAGSATQLKWQDFDIYGQPLHASGRCVVYNAKIKASGSPCQIMILHSRPATEMCPTSHPSLLRPTAVFADTIPFSFLTPDFIKTSQLLQNSVYDSSQARCFVAVGAFDIVESLPDHLCKLRETMGQDPAAYLNVLLLAALQLLSAMSHCLDQGFSVTEMDYEDVFLLNRGNLRGKVAAFLPHQRSLGEVPQGEAMCNFLDRLCQDGWWTDDEDDLVEEAEDGALVEEPGRVVSRLRALLEARRVECLGHVRTAVEFLLWGPAPSDLSITSRPGSVGGGASMAGREQELYVWLEKERAAAVGRLARSEAGLASGLTLDQFYTLKFLLKTSAACLAESVRRLAR
ncbi:hypothetical protein RRG08_014002 [Elysia crispata]|uniref:Uncharacterized protein n=1 Tax=Elysia crispata TaxID=231223 RepID=A0AAE1E861_9GAST|nr:hypothetical protein RRG08_014002 [Elysia crispata]